MSLSAKTSFEKVCDKASDKAFCNKAFNKTFCDKTSGEASCVGTSDEAYSNKTSAKASFEKVSSEASSDKTSFGSASDKASCGALKSELPKVDATKRLSVPTHIAITMDGNGRWAKAKGLPRTAGHKEGLTVAKKIVKAASAAGVKYITLYTFSTENWKRAESEVGFLMTLIKSHLQAEFAFYKENKIQVRHIGNLSRLPQDVQNEITKVVDETKGFDGTICTLAINYGGRDEIVRAVKSLLLSGISSEDIDEAKISGALDTKDTPDVDLMIRTGGEERISNFMLWQANYAELIFKKTLWPDYTAEEFLSDIEQWRTRQRRFGAAQ